jgi:hypothetical protein
MDSRFADIEHAVPLSGMLGYLNFSEGKPDPRFQKQVKDAYDYLIRHDSQEPWQDLHDLLAGKLQALKGGDSGAFRDAAQAEAVLALVFERLLAAYRARHADLLFHLADRDLLGPFFLARVFEAVLTQGAPWTDADRIVEGALARLNDYVGHRPIAILETRPRGEPYDHERVRPVPLYLRGAGTGAGRYQDLVAKALEILSATDAGILAEAAFDPKLLEELAVDPRPYDQGHPVNRRPNYIFGEWDPDTVDLQGRYTRFVVRQLVLDALLDRVGAAGAPNQAELLFEAAAVLGGTVLMAAGISGGSRSAHDSFTTLATLMPRIARYRDGFYTNLLARLGGPHGDRLRQEVATTRQPFGRARQHLNEYLARHRALQLQQRHLALLYADMGYPDAGRQEAARIPAASVRLLSEILGRLATAQREADRGQLAAAAALLPEAENLLHRGIHCGALADPWNILGFQGLFPLFAAREDSVRDTRIDDLVNLIEQVFGMYIRLITEAAGAGAKDLVGQLLPKLRRLAGWWDRFASVEVQDVRRVYGAEAVNSAEHLAKALGRWHEQGAATSDLAFWKRHLEGFRSPKAFALVVDALLRKAAYRASMALLINWVGQVEQVPLEDAGHSFHRLALQWVLGVTGAATEGLPDPDARFTLIRKFFDFLEANAGDYWHVPDLDAEVPDEEADEDDDEDLYGAAYEDVTYRDSTDDDQEGGVWDEGAPQEEFALETEGESLEKWLHFLATLARLWRVAARHGLAVSPENPEPAEALGQWLTAARTNQRHLLTLLEALHSYPIPQPLGSQDSLMEYDRRRVLKEQLLYTAIGACLETTLAVSTLRGALGQSEPAPGAAAEGPPWEAAALQLEAALWRGDAQEVRSLLPDFVRQFQSEPLLFTALADGGEPFPVFRARLAQHVLQSLVINLPRLGLLRETYFLLKTARAMETNNRPSGRGVTEFNHLFQSGFGAVAESVVEAAGTWDPASAGDPELVALLEKLTGPFLVLWVQHSQTLQLSSLETIQSEAEWTNLRQFIERYGGDLFHARFLTLANLRGVLHRGVGAYLDYVRDNPDPLYPVRLIDDLDRAIPRDRAERFLEVILRTLVENYEEYKDYNTSVAQSDYGENLHILLDFLRLKAVYDRQAWQFRPPMQVHEVLARQGRSRAAVLWQEAFTHIVREPAARFLEELARLEQTHGLRLRTISDRLYERFVKPLTLDRLCALVGPAMDEARGPEAAEAFARLEKELRAQAATPTGVGLDVPQWLRRVEAEVQQVRAARGAAATLAEQRLRVPRKLLSIQEAKQQLGDWEKPANPRPG